MFLTWWSGRYVKWTWTGCWWSVNSRRTSWYIYRTASRCNRYILWSCASRYIFYWWTCRGIYGAAGRCARYVFGRCTNWCIQRAAWSGYRWTCWSIKWAACWCSRYVFWWCACWCINGTAAAGCWYIFGWWACRYVNGTAAWSSYIFWRWTWRCVRSYFG